MSELEDALRFQAGASFLGLSFLFAWLIVLVEKHGERIDKTIRRWVVEAMKRRGSTD